MMLNSLKYSKIIFLIICIGVISCQSKSSSEILSKFHEIEVSMENSSEKIDEKNKEFLTIIAQQAKNNPDKFLPILKNATEILNINDSFVAYVEHIKVKIIEGAGNRNIESGELNNSSDIENHVKILIEEGEGKKLRNEIKKTRIKLLSFLDSNSQLLVNSDLYTKTSEGTPENVTWESQVFEYSPVAAVVTILTKIKNDAKNTTAQVLNLMVKDAVGFGNTKVSQKDFKIFESAKNTSDLFVKYIGEIREELVDTKDSKTYLKKLVAENKDAELRKEIEIFRTKMIGFLDSGSSINEKEFLQIWDGDLFKNNIEVVKTILHKTENDAKYLTEIILETLAKNTQK